MKVWVVEEGADYEGASVRAICSSRPLVKNFQVQIFSPDWICAWCEEEGFYCCERQHFPGSETSVDIWIR